MSLYSAETPIENIETPDGPLDETEGGVDTWLQISRDAFEQADAYFGSSIRRRHRWISKVIIGCNFNLIKRTESRDNNI